MQKLYNKGFIKLKLFRFRTRLIAKHFFEDIIGFLTTVIIDWHDLHIL